MPSARTPELGLRLLPAAWRAALVCVVSSGIVLLAPSLARAADVSHLEALATLDAVAGREAPARRYVEARVGGVQVVDNTGSLTATFGSGSPHTLLVAGLDEPGYIVSLIDEQGYLRLHRLADPTPHYQFDSFFSGQPVNVGLGAGKRLLGVAAAASVHLDDQRPYGTRSSRDAGLFVDIGAASREEALAAGVEVLHAVSFVKQFVGLGKGSRVTAPWISSRAGAAVLLTLAEAMESTPPEGRVTLAFVTQQHYYQAGLVRVLERVRADRVVLLRPGGGARPEVTPAEGWSSKLADELEALGNKSGYEFGRSSAEKLSFGPFATGDVWPDSEQSAVCTLGVENAGTPVETIDLDRLSQVAGLLGALCGLPRQEDAFRSVGRDPPTDPPVERTHAPSDPAADAPLLELLEQLVVLPGVSGSEGPVRSYIEKQLPGWARKRSRLDEKGNLIVRLGRDTPPSALFIAHMDEIGFKVRRIETDGTLDVEPAGGLLPDLFAWRPVVVHGKSGAVHGVMKRQQVVDIGAVSPEDVEAMGVSVGSTVTVRKRMRRLLGRRATGRSFDDRIGCAVLLSALRGLDPKRTPVVTSGPPVWMVFGVEEEIGLVGADHLAKLHPARRVYAVDSFVTSDSPLEDRRIAFAPLGKGFVIRAIDNSGITPPTEVERVASLATNLGIPMQRGVTSGGNDGSRFVRHGSVNIPLSWPLRYAHTATEVADLRDVEALAQIVSALVKWELTQ